MPIKKWRCSYPGCNMEFKASKQSAIQTHYEDHVRDEVKRYKNNNSDKPVKKDIPIWLRNVKN